MEVIIDHGFLVRCGESGNKNWLINWEKTGLNDVYFHAVQEKI